MKMSDWNKGEAEGLWTKCCKISFLIKCGQVDIEKWCKLHFYDQVLLIYCIVSQQKSSDRRKNHYVYLTNF